MEIVLLIEVDSNHGCCYLERGIRFSDHRLFKGSCGSGRIMKA